MRPIKKLFQKYSLNFIRFIKNETNAITIPIIGEISNIDKNALTLNVEISIEIKNLLSINGICLDI
jgi:hypothetical protein